MAPLGLALLWAAFAAAFLASHLRVRRARRKRRLSDRPALRARSSDLGLVLEGVSLLIVFAFRREAAHPALALAGLAIGAASAALAWAAVFHLGRQWRVRAVIAEDHSLITTGPYAVVRHPIYASLLGMLAASALLYSRWPAAAAALAVHLLGTEIRIHAEEKLLTRAFPEEFARYRKRVPAYFPALW